MSSLEFPAVKSVLGGFEHPVVGDTVDDHGDPMAATSDVDGSPERRVWSITSAR